MLTLFRELLADAVKRNRKLAGKVQVFLFLMDSIDRESGLRGDPTKPSKIPESDEVLEVYNIYENDDERLALAPPLRGREYPDLPKDHNFNASDEKENYFGDIPKKKHHELLPQLKAVEDYIFGKLGLNSTD